MSKPKIRARYKVVGPKMVTRTKKIAFMDESKSLQYRDQEVNEKVWMVYFPQGHSTQMDEANLRLNNLHLKPKLVDMETGDVLETGGDAYDLEQPIADRDLELVEDDELLGTVSQKKQAIKAT